MSDLFTVPVELRDNYLRFIRVESRKASHRAELARQRLAHAVQERDKVEKEAGALNSLLFEIESVHCAPAPEFPPPPRGVKRFR